MIKIKFSTEKQAFSALYFFFSPKISLSSTRILKNLHFFFIQNIIYLICKKNLWLTLLSSNYFLVRRLII